MTLLDHYNRGFDGKREDNPAQREVLGFLQKVSDELQAEKSSWFWPWRTTKKIKGLYIYGPVGGGKTYLMDLFYQNTSLRQKARYHFHAFMQQVDSMLRQFQGKPDPVRLIAKRLVKSFRLLCLDECFVHDVADAMILAELLQSLLDHGVVFIITSNIHPDNLYQNGLQRARFLPAIALIKQHCQVVSLDHGTDYRVGGELLLNTYLYPLSPETDVLMEQQFHAIESGTNDATPLLMIQHRAIPVMKFGQKAVWFEFDVICNIPRSQLDYLELSERFDTIFVSHLRALTPLDTAQVVLLIHFIDVMYDKHRRIIISSAVPLDELYQAGPMLKRFQRTLSRLEEMQTRQYLKSWVNISKKPS